MDAGDVKDALDDAITGVEQVKVRATVRDCSATAQRLLSDCSATTADVYFGRQYEVLTERSKIKRRTMEQMKKEHLTQTAA
jgi:hypothetical protein